jgi:hypothetical protein
MPSQPSARGVGDLRVVEHKIPLVKRTSQSLSPEPTRGSAAASVGHVGAGCRKSFRRTRDAQGDADGFPAEEEICGGAGGL